MSILKEIAKSSRWSEKVFDGKIIIEGRILSPAEAESAGLSSALIASTLANPEDIKRIQQMTEQDDNFDDLIEWSKRLKPEKLLELAAQNDKIICSCVRRCSVDQGKTFEDFKLVFHEKDQDADKNQLWIGVVSDEDRAKLLEHCLQGHVAAANRIRGLV
tara:strand:- start:216 stop:695 length:480 start_codon:yes stop_codon:yes gene_type:complete